MPTKTRLRGSKEKLSARARLHSGLRSTFKWLSGALALAMPFVATGPAWAGPLASPYQGAAPAQRIGVPTRVFCPTPSPIGPDLDLQSAFDPGNYSKMVPARITARKTASAPVESFLGRVTDLADRALAASPQAKAAAQKCLAQWLLAWAEGDALLGNVSEPEGRYEREWMITGLGLAFLAAHADEASPKPEAAVQAWFRRAAAPLPSSYRDDAPTKNNHWYWGGLAAVVSGTLTSDHASYAWGMKQFRLGIAAIDADGFLPLELKRGEMALSYHAFSASALVMMAQFAKANGELRPTDIANLQRLVHRVLTGLADPTPFEQRAGSSQHALDPSGIRALSWLEVYYALTKDPLAEPWLRRFRPMKLTWLGGNLTSAFGPPIASGPAAASPLIHP